MAGCGSADPSIPDPGNGQGATPAAERVETVSIGQITLRLFDTPGGCEIAASNEAEPRRLGLSRPCFFILRDGAVQRYNYPESGIDAVIMVGGGVLSDADRSKWNLAANERCGNAAQPIIVAAGKVRLNRQLGGGLFCRRHGLDEKVFASAAQEP